jgi:hypothetical protein
VACIAVPGTGDGDAHGFGLQFPGGVVYPGGTVATASAPMISK